MFSAAASAANLRPERVSTTATRRRPTRHFEIGSITQTFTAMSALPR
jgi:hypothetical protein